MQTFARNGPGHSSFMALDEVFIIRFWREEAGTRAQSRWRAQVRSVNTKERQIADNIDSVFELIVRRLRAVQSEKEYPK